MHILMIEDDETLCHTVSFQLKNYGYTVDCCYDGTDGLAQIQTTPYDLIILDRMLPSIDGIYILERIRSLHISTPVIMVTALSSLNDKISGLDAGADDYLAKPFAIEELLARIRALSRRPAEWSIEDTLVFGNVTLNLTNLTLSTPQNTCTLSKKEMLLFEVFFRQPRSVLPRTLLLSKVWGTHTEVEDGNLDNYIHFLRRRLRTIDGAIEVKTIRGIGYQLETIYD